MSAYMVDRGHIAYMVEAAIGQTHGFSWFYKGRRHSWARDRETATLLGQMLWDENLRSIHERYPDTVENMDNAPGPVGETYAYAHPSPSALERLPAPDPVQVLKACACYAYQSCETDEWEDSEAFAVVQALRDCAINALPGYEAAAWGVPEAWDTALRLPDEDDLAEVMGYEGQGEVKQ